LNLVLIRENRFKFMARENPMKLFVPKAQLQQVSAVLDQERVTYEVTGQISSLVMAGKEIGEVTEVKAELLEVEVPALYIFEDDPRSLRAFRLPSGKRLILTDVDGNFERLVQPPPGWKR
jgi:hypothetical protein